MDLPSGTVGSQINWLMCDVILIFCSLQQLSNNVEDCSPSEIHPTVQINIFSWDVISLKSWDFVFLQEWSGIWQRYSPNVTTASQNEVIHLWCDSRFSSDWRKTEHDYKMKWFFCVMWYVYIVDEKGERFNPIHTTQLHLLSKWSDSSVMSFLYIGVRLIRKVRYLFLLQEGSPIWRGYSANGTAVSKIKWFICDVITDSHLIAGRWNRTINPRKLIYRWKWSDYSVMWSYLHRWWERWEI